MFSDDPTDRVSGRPIALLVTSSHHALKSAGFPHRINTVTKAWETLRPTKTFAGLTLAQFKARCSRASTRAPRLATLEHQVTSALDKRDDADIASLDSIKLVVNA